MKKPVLSVPGAEPAARRRTAPKHAETSDVRRFRGVLPASVLAAVAVVVALIATDGLAALRAPGPQSRPHQKAKLTCDACHRDGKPAATACPRCHGGHASRRSAHQDLRRAGEMTCATCHRIHRADEGVSFAENGSVWRYGSGWQRQIELSTLFRPRNAVSVALVPAGACAGCHDLKSPRDPIAQCLLPGQESLGLDRPTVCFDEHRDITTIAGAGAKVAPGATTERDAAWEAAREAAAVVPTGGFGRGGLSRPLWWLGIGLAVGLSVLGVERGRQLLRDRKKKDATPEVRASAVVRLPQIDESTCLGCYACVDACPYDVIEVRRFVAVVARPDDCCGLTLCEQRCPNGSLVVRDGEPIEDRPRVGAALESADVPGLYLAGDLTGLPLIKNAINQGAEAMRGIAESLGRASGEGYDVIVVGTGPAGISALLEAKQKGLRALGLDQGSVASSIKSFPRGKLVFDQPLDIPLTGELWLEQSSKEELLAKWLRIVRKEKLEIVEHTRVVGVERASEGRFVVRTEGGGTHEARRVLLAVGRRGTPRTLSAEISEAAESSVFYSLADARSFAGQHVLVVGLGDSAMEAAIALAAQPSARVTIAYRGSGFRRGKAKNIAEVRRLVEAGRIELVLDAEVRRIEPRRVSLRTKSGDRTVDADAVIALIGAIPPWDLLERCGVSRR